MTQLEALEVTALLNEVSIRIHEEEGSDVDLDLKIDYYVFGVS